MGIFTQSLVVLIERMTWVSVNNVELDGSRFQAVLMLLTLICVDRAEPYLAEATNISPSSIRSGTIYRLALTKSM